MKWEQLAGMVASRAAVPLSSRLVVRESFPVKRDVKDAAHAAHAVDPSLPDAIVAKHILPKEFTVRTIAIQASRKLGIAPALDTESQGTVSSDLYKTTCALSFE
jgi:hypothetical protein